MDPWLEKIPQKREQLTTLAFWPGESYGQRSLAGKESDTTEKLSLGLSINFYSCSLEVLALLHLVYMCGCYNYFTPVFLFYWTVSSFRRKRLNSTGSFLVPKSRLTLL